MYRRNFFMAALALALCAGAQARLADCRAYSATTWYCQQQHVNAVWGKADPGAKLEITFQHTRQGRALTEEQTVTAGADGAWKAALKSKRADGKVYTLRVTHGAESLTSTIFSLAKSGSALVSPTCSGR